MNVHLPWHSSHLFAQTTILAALLTLQGCAGRHPHQDIIVDTKGVDMNRYHRHLTECSAYAEQVRTGEKVAKGTVAGGVVGAAVGAAVGDSGTAKRSAGAGAILGAAKGAARGAHEKNQVVKNCMRGRGYRVLN